MSIQVYFDQAIGEIPSTPTDLYADIPVQAEKVLLNWAEHLGTPIAYIQEHNGRLLQNIFPVKSMEDDQISSSSKVQLGLHTETAFHPHKPNYVLLLCLRSDAAALTTYASLNEILPKLPIQTIKILKQKWFTTTIDQSFRLQGERDKTITMAVLTDNGITYDETLMKGINLTAQKALVELNTAITKSTHAICLHAGDLAVIDNSTTVHGRSPFSARYDGSDRWVVRAMVLRNPPIDEMNGSTVMTTFDDPF